MGDEHRRQRHEQWLMEVTVLPTAAGREDRVIEWVRRWVDQRPDLHLEADGAGNLFITRTESAGVAKPLLITAHLDHPAFVVSKVGPTELELEFRGSVHDPYFADAAIEIFNAADERQYAKIVELDPKAKPFKRAIARRSDDMVDLEPGDVGRWRLDEPLPRIEEGLLHTHACDDLAAVAAALASLDVLSVKESMEHVGVMLTRAEEVGFIGALAACRDGSVPAGSRLICLENSRSFAESPIGGGPILRVGDRQTVFDPRLTNRLGFILSEYAEAHPDFRWQRKLMPGGTCEATAFSTWGYEATCICLPLGNYHNMVDIDAVQSGQRPAQVGPEFIAVEDYHGMIEMLAACAHDLDSNRVSTLRERLEKLLEEREKVLAANVGHMA